MVDFESWYGDKERVASDLLIRCEEVNAKALGALIEIGEDESRSATTRRNVVSQIVFIEETIHLGVRVAGKRIMVHVSNFQWGEVIGVDAPPNKPIVSSALVFDLQPNRLKAFVVEI